MNHTFKTFHLRSMVALCLSFVLLISAFPLHTAAEETPTFSFNAKSVILIEAGSGTVLYESNADEALPPASVTKIMTLLLVMEALKEGRIQMEDSVPISEYAAGMGGSQVYLEPGEDITVRELIKCVAVASANDAAVALAELVAGSCEAFVARMNERAAELNMKNTTFENPTGLDDNVTKHLTSARDIAAMSMELLRHPEILEFTGIWMDSIRNGSFGLTNTNRLIRFYQGANGLKTGSTSKAKFCISAAALRDGMQLIAVVMGSPTRDERNNIAKSLLDYGFATYGIAAFPEADLAPIPVKGSLKENCSLRSEAFSVLTKKGAQSKIRIETDLPEALASPVNEGDVVGYNIYYLDDTCIGKSAIYATEQIDKLTFAQQLGRILKNFWIL